MLKKIVFALALTAFISNGYAQKYGGGSSGSSTDSKTTKTTQSTPENDVLETLGLMGGVSLYNTYILIGAVSDAYANKGYTGELATELLNKQVALIDAQIQQYKTVSKSFVKKTNDKEAITTINEIFEGLKTQANHALEYIETDEVDAADKYEEQRLENWAKISEFLGME